MLSSVMLSQINLIFVSRGNEIKETAYYEFDIFNKKNKNKKSSYLIKDLKKYT